MSPISAAATERKSVKWGPLSPTSYRSLAKIHKTAAAAGSSTHLHDPDDESQTLVRTSRNQGNDGYFSPQDENSQDISSPEESRRRRRRRRRRNSDPSSDRPHHSSKYRRRSRSPSPVSEDEVEVLPDRFDDDGRPLNGSRSRGVGAKGDGQSEMVEKLASDFGAVMEGKKSWKDMLAGLVGEGGALSSLAGGSQESINDKEEGRRSERKERRRRERDYRDRDRDRD